VSDMSERVRYSYKSL